MINIYIRSGDGDSKKALIGLISWDPSLGSSDGEKALMSDKIT